MWAFYPFEKLVFKNVLKILLINIWIFIPLLIYMWEVEGVTILIKKIKRKDIYCGDYKRM